MITYIAHIETCHQKCDIIVRENTVEEATFNLTNAIASAKCAIESQYKSIMESKKEEKKAPTRKDVTEYDTNTANAVESKPSPKQMSLLQRCGVHPNRLKGVFTSSQASAIISRIQGNPQTGQLPEPMYAQELRTDLLYGKPLDEWLIEIL